MSKDGRRALLIKLRNPWVPLSVVGGLMGAGGAPSSTNPQLNWWQKSLQDSAYHPPLSPPVPCYGSNWPSYTKQLSCLQGYAIRLILLWSIRCYSFCRSFARLFYRWLCPALPEDYASPWTIYEELLDSANIYLLRECSWLHIVKARVKGGIAEHGHSSYCGKGVW